MYKASGVANLNNYCTQINNHICLTAVNLLRFYVQSIAHCLKKKLKKRCLSNTFYVTDRGQYYV